MRIIEDSPRRLIVPCHQTVWIAVAPGLLTVLIAVLSISQRHWSLLWSTIPLVALGWFFVNRDWLAVNKVSRRVTLYSMRPLGLRAKHFSFDEIKDVGFDANGLDLRPALITSTGVVPLSSWQPQGTPRIADHVRIKILVAMDKLRPELL